MGGFTFRLEREDGSPAEPAFLQTAVPNWSVGHTIPLGSRTLQVVAIRQDDPALNPVLVVREA